MKTPAPNQPDPSHLPILSSQSQGWDNIVVEQYQSPPGEADCHFSDDHTVYLSLASRPVRLLEIRGGKTYRGLFAKGDIAVTPEKMPFFCRWEGDDHYLLIRLASHFIQKVARETLDSHAEPLALIPEFHIRDPQIESIGLLLLAELQQESLGSKLYIDSLTNVLAVHLLRQYATTKPRLATYTGGLPERQLLQILDYIHEHLHQEIKLADLARRLDMSQFHFGHLFKQSLGTSPYQYLLQQRVERAKQLLKQTDQSIVEIALLCGFNSHSHLSKQFRQFTGTTPSAYRAN